jgi:hypothetical protein
MLRRTSFCLLTLALCCHADAAPNPVGLAFVTSTQGTADLSSWSEVSGGGVAGLAAGDRICQIRAHAAGRSGAEHYRAWLSTASTDAYCHVRGLAGTRATQCGLAVPPPAIGPWSSVDGRLIIATLDEALFPEHVMYRGFDRDEAGLPLQNSNGLVWTGSDAQGAHAFHGSCSNWTRSVGNEFAQIGRTHRTGAQWSDAAFAPCSNRQHLVCMTESGGDDAPQPVEGEGPLVFVTSVAGTGNLSSWADAGGRVGVQAGDRICQVRATVAGLTSPESFKAFLSSTTTGAAIDRFENDGPRFRLDGVRVAADLADLADGELATSVGTDEFGDYVPTTRYAWTGSTGLGEISGHDCQAWTNGLSPARGNLGMANASDGSWSGFTDVACNFMQHALYCVSDLPRTDVIEVFGDGFEEPALR